MPESQQSASHIAHTAVILAAGKGKRMHSPLPKVLHELDGRRLIDYVLDLTEKLESSQTVVVLGHGRAAVAAALEGRRVSTVIQDPPLGTGHAVMQALAAVSDTTLPVLVLAGDTPLLRLGTVRNLLSTHRTEEASATVLVAEADDPTGCGRIMLDERGNLRRIVEETDASESERAIRLVNTSTYVFEFGPLQWALAQLTPDNAQGEYYLTDAIGILVSAGHRVRTAKAAFFEETLGINSPQDLERAKRFLACLGSAA